MRKNYLNLFTFLLVTLLLIGCSTPREDRIRNMSVAELIQEGQSEMQSGNYQSSIDHFSAIEARYPYSTQAEQAKLNKIYTYYLDREFESAEAEIESFRTLYPNHPEIAYTWYIEGIVNFDRARSILDKLMPPDRTKIDPYQMEKSLQAFLHVVEHYPHTPYADDSAQRVVYLRNTLAQSEMHIAQFYYNRKAYVGAANRAQFILDNYDETPSLSDALYLQIKAYRHLGMNDLAENRLAIMRHNYPGDERLNEF